MFTVDGPKVYHAGDTDLIPEKEDLTVDVALLPAGGLATMNATAAVQAAGLVHAVVVVPMHYGKIPFSGGAGRNPVRRSSGLMKFGQASGSSQRGGTVHCENYVESTYHDDVKPVNFLIGLTHIKILHDCDRA